MFVCIYQQEGKVKTDGYRQEKLDQASCENRRTIFKDSGKDYIRTVSLLKVKDIQSIENITWKNLNNRHNEVTH